MRVLIADTVVWGQRFRLRQPPVVFLRWIEVYRRWRWLS